MKLFSQIAGATLAAMCLVGAASAAFAHHVPMRPYDEESTRALLLAAQSAGIQVFTDKDPRAAEHCVEGLLGVANRNKQVLFCIQAHGDDVDALSDTVRHELVHVAQFCKGRSVGATSALLYPELQDEALEAARQLHMPVDKYGPSQYATEAEARVLAQLYNDQQVADLLKRHC